jgi:hypothetical protein
MLSGALVSFYGIAIVVSLLICIGDVVWRALTTARPKVRYPVAPNRDSETPTVSVDVLSPDVRPRSNIPTEENFSTL